MGVSLGNIFSRMMDTDIATGTEGVIEIGGIFNGCIYNGFQVFVSASGTLNGEVQTKKLEIYGTVKGKIEADNLTIHSSGQLIYEQLKYRDIIIEDGALLTGIKEAGEKAAFTEANKEVDMVGQSASDAAEAFEQGSVQEHAQFSNNEMKGFTFENNSTKHSKTIEKGDGETGSAKFKVQETYNNAENNVRIKGQPLFKSSF
ncbi:MAG: Polymer-forming cytoskeletal [Thermoanaerobacteraceae bacterium]|nr:Polymer-forming cytoskeletal [Thermoanaerobacteraceae bacterium]